MLKHGDISNKPGGVLITVFYRILTISRNYENSNI